MTWDRMRILTAMLFVVFGGAGSVSAQIGSERPWGSVPALATAPVACAAATKGRLYIDTDDNFLYYCNGTSFVASSTDLTATQVFSGAPMTFGSAADAANSVRFNDPTNADGCLTFEGSVANDFETKLCVVDPTVGDQTFRPPDQAAAGTFTLAGLEIVNIYTVSQRFPLGTVGLPGITWSGGDTNTGLYSRAGGNISFSSDGSSYAEHDATTGMTFIGGASGAPVCYNTGIGTACVARVLGGTKALTGGVATAVFNLNIPSNSATGGIIDYTVDADDGTDFQSRSGTVHVSGVNKVGTETCAVYGIDSVLGVVGTANPNETQDGSGAGTMSLGTMTYAWTSSNSPTNGCQFLLNGVSSLTETTFKVTGQIRKSSGTGSIVWQ